MTQILQGRQDQLRSDHELVDTAQQAQRPRADVLFDVFEVIEQVVGGRGVGKVAPAAVEAQRLAVVARILFGAVVLRTCGCGRVSVSVVRILCHDDKALAINF